jgi:NAD(P)-dependent dehydrogenase (short-subunit alcohol dehydrogenase family)
MDVRANKLRVLVTAGAAGIGRAIVETFVNNGARVHICDVARQTLDDCRKAFPGIGATLADVANVGQVDKLFEEATQHLGGLDVLVNNAGRQHSHDSIPDISTEDFDWTLRTNLYGMFWLTKAAIPHMPPGTAIIRQMISRGIRVNAVAPGPFWTPLQVSGGQTQKNVEQFGAQTPIGRPGQPAEIAPVYVALAMARMSYVTGQVYGASGGEGQP